jgi:hypothetical protein
VATQQQPESLQHAFAQLQCAELADTSKAVTADVNQACTVTMVHNHRLEELHKLLLLLLRSDHPPA